MKKPSDKVLERTRGTFLEFLTRENLLPLLPSFLVAHTVQGYGYLDEVHYQNDSQLLRIFRSGVCNLRFDLEHSQVCGEHIAADS